MCETLAKGQLAGGEAVLSPVRAPSLQTILDLFGVRGRAFSDPYAFTSTHNVACQPTSGWWKSSGGQGNFALLLLPICERCRDGRLPQVALVGEAPPCGSMVFPR